MDEVGMSYLARSEAVTVERDPGQCEALLEPVWRVEDGQAGAGRGHRARATTSADLPQRVGMEHLARLPRACRVERRLSLPEDESGRSARVRAPKKRRRRPRIVRAPSGAAARDRPASSLPPQTDSWKGRSPVSRKLLMSSRSSQKAMRSWPSPIVYLPAETPSNASRSDSAMQRWGKYRSIASVPSSSLVSNASGGAEVKLGRTDADILRPLLGRGRERGEAVRGGHGGWAVRVRV